MKPAIAPVTIFSPSKSNRLVLSLDRGCSAAWLQQSCFGNGKWDDVAGIPVTAASARVLARALYLAARTMEAKP